MSEHNNQLIKGTWSRYLSVSSLSSSRWESDRKLRAWRIGGEEQLESSRPSICPPNHQIDVHSLIITSSRETRRTRAIPSPLYAKLLRDFQSKVPKRIPPRPNTRN
ncbi:hypothetical protein TcasGA2_TC033569 [Tribolium castaneum]|uniref:Uncharacterized protein n=1 Tax=Tribolium castaneum TaxID=7070 RepID=A0A139WFF4_TRICA|nr:hypothetical protein TcasGA2_TC033569 [Tribolium castaneum]